MTDLPPLSLYIHIPWCEKKCPYCDFNSHTSNTLPETAYVEKLIADLISQKRLAANRKLHSIFIGGGTPSLFSAQSISTVLQAAHKHIGFIPDIEITLEANPSSAEQKKFEGLFAAGVNRLSIGVQSFHQQALNALGRIHNPHDAQQAIKRAQAAGFERINIDLMHGLPEQTDQQALADLQQAIDYNVEHISWYQLTIEPNTAFYRFPPTLPNDETLSHIQEQGHNLLHQQGYTQYEVSAYARNKAVARHNINYWQFGDYLAIGAGAHGKITHLDKSIIRFNNTRNPNHYLARDIDFTASIDTLDKNTALFEALLNGLRLKQGINIETLCLYTGANHLEVNEALAPAIKKGLIRISPNRVLTTELGYNHLNSILEMLID